MPNKTTQILCDMALFCCRLWNHVNLENFSDIIILRYLHHIGIWDDGEIILRWSCQPFHSDIKRTSVNLIDGSDITLLYPWMQWFHGFDIIMNQLIRFLYCYLRRIASPWIRRCSMKPDSVLSKMGWLPGATLSIRFWVWKGVEQMIDYETYMKIKNYHEKEGLNCNQISAITVP